MWRLCSVKFNHNITWIRNNHFTVTCGYLKVHWTNLISHSVAHVYMYMFRGIFTQNTTLAMPIFGRTASPGCQYSLSGHDWICRPIQDISNGRPRCFSITCPAYACMRTHMGHAIEDHGISDREHPMQLQCAKPSLIALLCGTIKSDTMHRRMHCIVQSKNCKTSCKCEMYVQYIYQSLSVRLRSSLLCLCRCLIFRNTDLLLKPNRWLLTMLSNYDPLDS